VRVSLNCKCEGLTQHQAVACLHGSCRMTQHQAVACLHGSCQAVACLHGSCRMRPGTRRSCSRLATRAFPLTSPTTALPVSVHAHPVSVRVHGGGGAVMERLRTLVHARTHVGPDAPAGSLSTKKLAIPAAMSPTDPVPRGQLCRGQSWPRGTGSVGRGAQGQ